MNPDERLAVILTLAITTVYVFASRAIGNVSWLSTVFSAAAILLVGLGVPMARWVTRRRS